MSTLEYELAHQAYTRYAVIVIGGDAVYLKDCMLGNNLYLGSGKLLKRTDLRKYVTSLDTDLKNLSIRDFLTKHGFDVD